MRPMGRTLAIAAIIGLAPGGASGQAPASPQQARAAFRNPPKAYRPMVRWFWPDGDVRDDELRREVRVLDEAHFGGAEIQPFRFGLDPLPDRVHTRLGRPCPIPR